MCVRVYVCVLVLWHMPHKSPFAAAVFAAFGLPPAAVAAVVVAVALSAAAGAS